MAASPSSPTCTLSLQRLQSGTTGVCALVAGNTLHVAWLGDSQVVLVQQGQVVKLMEPHRPERQVRGPQAGRWSGGLGRKGALDHLPRKLLVLLQGRAPCLTQVAGGPRT